MKFRGIVSLLAAGAASVSLASPALAQTTGGLSGQIIDANTQAPVAEAVVIATSPSLQGEQTAVTDSSGTFEITLLPSGVYTLNVQRDGYNAFTQSGLTIRLDKTIRVKLQLVPDSVKGEAVEITVSRPVITTSSAQTGSTVSKEQMTLVPYGRGARNFEAVATSVPGVQSDGYGLTMNGASSPETAYIIDGVMVNDPAYGLQGTTLLQDFVQEVDIKTGGYQAEYGRATGGVVNVVTKSGGNDFHGSVFVNWSPYEASRATLGNAGLAIGTQSSQAYNLDFGAEVGGPIIKDKLWFFAGFAPQIQALNIDRIIQARSSDASGRAVINPATGFPAVTEVARQTYSQKQTAYQFTGKLTYLINENHSLALAVYGNPTKTTGAQAVGAINEGAMLADASTGSTDVSLRYSGKLLNKTMLVEASAGYHSQNGAQGGSPTYTLTDVQGISAAKLKDTPFVSWRSTYNLLNPQFDDGMIPSSQKTSDVRTKCAVQANGFDPCPILNYGTGGFGYIGDVKLSRAQLGIKFSNFVELAGHHQFKYGVDASADTYDQTKQYTGGSSWRAITDLPGAPPNRFQLYRGYGQIDPKKPGTPLFDTSTPGVLQDVGNVLSKKSTNSSLAFFAQDSWNIMDKVVLDIGIRGEKQTMKGDAATPTADTNKLDLFSLMPRIGLIYDWTGRGLSKVYASFGRFYEYIPLDMGDRALSVETQVQYFTNAANCGVASDPRTCSIVPGAAAGGRTFNFAGSGVTLVDPNLAGQYTDEYQAGAQYQAYRDIIFGVDYVRKQVGRVVEDMSTDDGTTYFLSNPGVSGGYGYSTVTGTGETVVWPVPKRIYDGLTLSVNKAFSDNYLISASYTLSSFRGNYPGLISPGYGSAAGQLDPNILAEYDLVSLLPNKEGPLKGDTPNAFKLDTAYVYEVNSALTLNLGGNLNVRQGGPLDYLGAHPSYGAGLAYILPRGSNGRLPWQWQVNLRAAANYKLTKDYGLGFNVDIFNATNNKAVTGVDENYTFDAVNPIVNGKVSDLGYLKNTAGAPVRLNQRFNSPISYQLPFSARVGARLSF